MSWHHYQVHTFYHVMQGIYNECIKGGDKEVTGVLIGKPCVWNGQYYIMINHYFPLGATSSRTHVTVDPESLAETMKEASLKFHKELVIGWYHSHPSYGLFLSETDLLTQRLIFREWFNVALVVDHIRGEHGFFTLTADGGYTRLTHAVWKYVGGRQKS